jgi:multiple sugar transport system substrate-binding protein
MRRFAPVLVIAGALLLPACGKSERPESSPARTATPAKPDRVTVTFCASPFAPSAETAAVVRFNKAHGDDGLRARFRRLPDSAQDQYDALVRLVGHGCDVAELDVVWIGDFAAAGVLVDLTEHVEARKDEFIGATVETARYDDRYWGVPRSSDVGLLYYRTDVGAAPKTWQDVYDIAGRKHGIVYQGAAYESLTTNFVEIAYAAGGRVLSEDGRASAIDSAENLRALKLMRDGIVRGAAPSAVTELREEDARLAFSAGRATFMRNWSYAHALADLPAQSKVVGKFTVAPLPAFGQRAPSGVLGGRDLVVATGTDNEQASLTLLDFLTGEDEIGRSMADFSIVPPLEAAYDAPDIGGSLPHYAQLRAALEAAKPRPVTAGWGTISNAIFTNVHAALEGRVTPRAALQAADRQIERVLARVPTPR